MWSMAPSYANADLTYRQTVDLLRAACTVLEFHLPPASTNEPGESSVCIPSSRPVTRASVDSVLTCAQCAEELQDVDPGKRAGHQCTHERPEDVEQPEVRRDRIVDDGIVRRRQPSTYII